MTGAANKTHATLKQARRAPRSQTRKHANTHLADAPPSWSSAPPPRTPPPRWRSLRQSRWSWRFWPRWPPPRRPASGSLVAPAGASPPAACSARFWPASLQKVRVRDSAVARDRLPVLVARTGPCCWSRALPRMKGHARTVGPGSTQHSNNTMCCYKTKRSWSFRFILLLWVWRLSARCRRLQVYSATCDNNTITARCICPLTDNSTNGLLIRFIIHFDWTIKGSYKQVGCVFFEAALIFHVHMP